MSVQGAYGFASSIHLPLFEGKRKVVPCFEEGGIEGETAYVQTLDLLSGWVGGWVGGWFGGLWVGRWVGLEEGGGSREKRRTLRPWICGRGGWVGGWVGGRRLVWKRVWDRGSNDAQSDLGPIGWEVGGWVGGLFGGLWVGGWVGGFTYRCVVVVGEAHRGRALETEDPEVRRSFHVL